MEVRSRRSLTPALDSRLVKAVGVGENDDDGRSRRGRRATKKVSDITLRRGMVLNGF